MDLHEDFTRREQSQEASDRVFSLALAAGLAGMGLMPLVTGGSMRAWAVATGMVLAIVGVARPAILSPVRRLFTWITSAVGAVVSAVTATLLFYLVVTPTGLVARWRGQDSLGLRFDAGAASYWKRRDPPGPSPDSMPRQF